MNTIDKENATLTNAQATSARTTAKRYKYFRLIDRRSGWSNYSVRCDATAETAEVIERLDNLATTSYFLDLQRGRYSKHPDYVIKHGRLYLVDNYYGSLIPQSIKEFIALHI